MKSFFIVLNRLFVNKSFIILFCILLFSSSIISFILKINLSSLLGSQDLNPFLLDFDIKTRTGGVVNDLATHWAYITHLKENFTNLFKLEMGLDTNLINFPLHNIIFSQIYFFNDSLKNYLLIVFVFSLSLPIIFFLCLQTRFKNTNKYKLILLSSIIYLFPVFQYSAIWGNNHITALIFLTIGIFFHLKLKDCNYKSFKYYFLTVFFVSLACYTRQYYVFFFLYLILDFYLEIKIKYFLLNGIFLLILASPGLIFLFNNPLVVFGLGQEITNFNSSILISASIVLFYLLPFIFQYLINLPIKIEKNIPKILNTKIFLVTLVITVCCVYTFKYESVVGGGIFYKIFILMLNNKVLFFCSSFLGIYSILFFCEKNIKNIFLSILILITFSTGFFIFQKYFEPMFFILFLIYFDRNKILISIEKNNFFYIFYFSGYFLISNYIYFFGL